MMDPTLYKAIMEGDVKFLEKKNADELRGQLTPNKNTVLHVAVQFNKKKCVMEILHKCGRSLLCSVNVKGDTSLHISTRERRTEIVKALIGCAKGLDVGELESGTRAIKEMLRMRNKEGDTALYEAVRNNVLDVVDILIIEDPEYLHFSNNAEETLLYLAAERGYQDIVFKILKNCNSQAYVGPNRRTALHAATLNRHTGCIKTLYYWNPSLIKEADKYGWTPLHCAAWMGNRGIVEELLHVDKSIAYGDKSIAYLVTDDDENMTSLHIAASQGHIGVMKELLSDSPDCWEMLNSRGQNILHIAVEHEEEEIIKFISVEPFFISLINQKDINGNTPLHLIADKSNYYKYEFKQESRVDRMAWNKENLTPLHIATDGHKAPFEARLGGYRTKLELGKSKARVYEREYIKQNAKTFSETHLIVATLIATVTFAAGFTIPGGYSGNDGPNQGLAVLTKRGTFIAFALTNTIAVVSSVTAVCLHLFASFYRNEAKRTTLYFSALVLIIAAMGAMVFAFMTGFCAVLEHSPGITICVFLICGPFFPIFFYVFNQWFKDLL